MTPTRNSSATEPNKRLKDTAADRSTAESLSTAGPAAHQTSNIRWLQDTGLTEGIILLGGTSVAHFRVRNAQAQLRNDLTPSYWSLAGLLIDGSRFVSVPLDRLDESSLVPVRNGVQLCPLADYDDTTRFPNIAVLRFTKNSGPVLGSVCRVILQRSIIDLPSLILPWLGYIWGAGQQTNPLLLGVGVPSAAFVETAHGMAGVELTPGLASAASCPEAIWQSAKWWHDFYAGPRGVQNKDHARGIIPEGFYAIRQPAAAVIGPKDEKRGGEIVARADSRKGELEILCDETLAEAQAAASREARPQPAKKSSARKRGRKSAK